MHGERGSASRSWSLKMSLNRTRVLLRSRSTGSSINGANLSVCEESLSYQRRNPRARNRTLIPWLLFEGLGVPVQSE